MGHQNEAPLTGISIEMKLCSSIPFAHKATKLVSLFSLLSVCCSAAPWSNNKIEANNNAEVTYNECLFECRSFVCSLALGNEKRVSFYFHPLTWRQRTRFEFFSVKSMGEREKEEAPASNQKARAPKKTCHYSLSLLRDGIAKARRENSISQMKRALKK